MQHLANNGNISVKFKDDYVERLNAHWAFS